MWTASISQPQEEPLPTHDYGGDQEGTHRHETAQYRAQAAGGAFCGPHGIRRAEFQAASWLRATMIGLALLSGRLFARSRLDRAVALVAFAGLLWLVIRVEG